MSILWTPSKAFLAKTHTLQTVLSVYNDDTRQNELLPEGLHIKLRMFGSPEAVEIKVLENPEYKKKVFRAELTSIIDAIQGGQQAA